MSAISWANLETFTAPPASTSTASSGDDWLRSFFTSLALGLQPSFLWPGSGGASLASAGISNFGNARCDLLSNASVVGGLPNGTLALTRTATGLRSLHHLGSAWTALLGHAQMAAHPAGPGRWLTQFGSGQLSGSTVGSLDISFASAYATPPAYVRFQNSLVGGGAPTYLVNISSITAGGFTSVFSRLNNIGAADGYYWESDGTL